MLLQESYLVVRRNQNVYINVYEKKALNTCCLFAADALIYTTFQLAVWKEELHK